MCVGGEGRERGGAWMTTRLSNDHVALTLRRSEEERERQGSCLASCP